VGGQGGEMTQTMYAHVQKCIIKKKSSKKKDYNQETKITIKD
jgi:hypothetical protein